MPAPSEHEESEMPSKQRDFQPVESWRRTELVQCGFPPELATRVSRDERYDLRELIELVHGGCTPAVAVRMLAPLEADGCA